MCHLIDLRYISLCTFPRTCIPCSNRFSFRAIVESRMLSTFLVFFYYFFTAQSSRHLCTYILISRKCSELNIAGTSFRRHSITVWVRAITVTRILSDKGPLSLPPIFSPASSQDYSGEGEAEAREIFYNYHQTPLSRVYSLVGISSNRIPPICVVSQFHNEL